MTIGERERLAKEPIQWEGDLSDDCIARWAGLVLRAEWMDEDYWWWAVYDMENGEVAIDDSNEYPERFIGGESSRKKAESVAMEFMKNLIQESHDRRAGAKKHPYAWRLRLRESLPWFLITLGIGKKGRDCTKVNAEHSWYNIDHLHSGCYYCEIVVEGQLWKKAKDQ